MRLITCSLDQLGTSDFTKRLRMALILVVLCYCLYALLFIYHTSFVINGERFFTLFDDAMISMRYAKNLANGYGLVWNPGGERVEGYTNFLWVLCMALFHFLPISPAKISLLVQLSGMFLLLLNLLYIKKIADLISGGSWIACFSAVFFTAFYYPLLYWSLRGMELSILVLVLSLSVWTALRSVSEGRFSWWLFAFLGIGTLIRPDMIVASIVIFIHVLIMDSRNRSRNMLIGSAILSAFILVQSGFRLAYFGEILPNTYYLKMTGYPLALRVSKGLAAAVKFLVLLIPVAFLLPFLWGFSRQNPAARLLLSILGAQILYSIYVGGDMWEDWGRSNRYVTVAMPFFFVLVGCTLAEIAGLYSDPSRNTRSLFNNRRGIVGACLLLISCQMCFNSLFHPSRLAEFFLLIKPHHVLQDQRQVEIALMLKQITKPDAMLGVVRAGAVPYFSDRTSIDFLGKNDKKIARQDMILPAANADLFTKLTFFQPGHLKWDYLYSIGCRKPDIIVELWGAGKEVGSVLNKEYMGFKTKEGEMYFRRKSEEILWGKAKRYTL